MKIVLFIVFFPLLAAASDSSSSLKRMVEKEVKAHLPRGTRVVVENLRVRGELGEKSRLRLVAPHPPVGMVQLEAVTGSSSRRASVQGVVRAFLKVAVTRVAIPHKTRLKPAHLSFEEREISAHSRTGYFADWSSVEGMESRGYIRPGVVLNSANTSTPPLISRGERVELKDGKGRLALSATVVALEDGKLGQWIRTQNDRSKVIIHAKVIGPRQLSF